MIRMRHRNILGEASGNETLRGDMTANPFSGALSRRPRRVKSPVARGHAAVLQGPPSLFLTWIRIGMRRSRNEQGCVGRAGDGSVLRLRTYFTGGLEP